MTKEITSVTKDFLKIFYAKKMLSLFITILFIAGLLYLIVPGPERIEQFADLPESVKSDLPGDTVQNPNIAAYFSQKERDEITGYYWNFFKNVTYGFLPLPLFKINHPPEFAFVYIRDQQESTGLEEYYRPLRESFFVNIYEPLVFNQIKQRPLSFDNIHLDYQNQFYLSKATVRYYPSSVYARVVVYLGMWILGYFLIRLYAAALFTKTK